jgi:hypothetical protein
MTNVFAQETHLGVKGGLNVSDIGSSQVGLVTRLAYHIGGFAEFAMTPFFSIQADLVYSLQGAATDRSREIKLNYHYLNIPVVGRIYFYEDASLDLGLQYGYLLKAVNFNIINPTLTELNKHDLAGVVGLSYILSEKAIFSLRYNIGINSTIDENVIWELKKTNRVLQISAGYIF